MSETPAPQVVVALVTRYRVKNDEPGSPHLGKWLVEPGKYPFDPPGTRRWTRLPQLAAVFTTPPSPLPPGFELEPITFNRVTGQIEAKP